jgi:hypothetical protein
MEVTKALKAVVVTISLFVAGTIISTSLWAWFQSPDQFALFKNAFDLVVTQTLLPLFTTLAASVLGYIFAHAAVRAVEVYAAAAGRNRS